MRYPCATHALVPRTAPAVNLNPVVPCTAQVDALVSHIDGAVRSGDAGHQQELQLKLEEAEAELRKDKEANR